MATKPKNWDKWSKDKQWGYLRGLAMGRVERTDIPDHQRRNFRSIPTQWFKGDEKWELKAYYMGLLPELREVARKCGYALGVHGSMQRDLDLIAVAWSDKYVPYTTLAKRLHKFVCGAIYKNYSWTYKPHNRKATSMYVGNSAYIDLSVVCSP